ncbi:MAG: archaeal proteasome endopeptidase complex subunit beta [Candidatus Micrarchaeota archaeon]
MDEKENLKGTTTVGLVCSDGVVFAADKRASMGYFIANKETDKIHMIDEKTAITMAGLVADAQALVRIMKAEAQLYKMRTGKPLSVNAACMLLANLMHQYKGFPFMVQLLIGGYDSEPRIFNLDAVGGVTEEKFVSTGSGSPMVYGVLEESYREGKSVKENLALAVRAVSTAMKRDCASGDGIDLVAITKDGFKKYTKEEVNKFSASAKDERKKGE